MFRTVPVSIIFLIIKPTRWLVSQIYFWNKPPHVSDSSSVHHQQFFTVHTLMVYVIQLASRTKQQTSMTHIIAVCTVKNCWWWTEELSEMCTVFFFKNEFDKLMHVVIGSWWGNRREGDQWGDLGVDGWIILGWISMRWEVAIMTGLGWPRIETGGGRLWVQ